MSNAWERAGAKKITLPPVQYHEAEKMALDYWNTATDTAAKIAEAQFRAAEAKGDHEGAAVAARIHRLILAEKAPTS